MTQQQRTTFDSHVTGIVRSVNDKGLKLEGAETWLNVSEVRRRGRPARARPTGDLHAGQGGLSPRGGGTAGAQRSARARRQRRRSTAEHPRAYHHPTGRAQGRGRVRGLSWRPKVGDVLKIAAVWERWVNREDAEPSHALPPDAALDDELDGHSDMKTCRKCGESLPLGRFYAHPRMKDGHLNFCKECVKQRMREQRAGSDHVLMLQRKRGSVWDREKLKKYQSRVARNAHAMVRDHIRRGKIVRPDSCEECGSSDYGIEAAHADYTRPLDVRWLCRRCHRTWDQRDPKMARLNQAAF